MNLLLAVSWLNLTLVVERLGWVLLHSLWQFALVALLAGVTVRALRRRSASTRYGVLVSAMAVSVVVPTATWMLQHGDPSGHWTSREVSAAMPDTAEEANRRVPTSNLGDDTTLASVAPAETPIPRHAPSLAAIPEVPRRTPTDGVTPPSVIKQGRTMLQPWLGWIVAGWSLGVVICSLRPLLGWHTLRRLRRVGVAPVSDEVLSATQRLSKRLRLRRAVLVLQSTLARMPIVVGYVRPVILLPVSLLTSIPAAQLEAILAHELAHVRRHDFVVNLLQTLVETLFFYHPAVWWLSRKIRIEREHCCDDQVVALLGNPVDYGRALVAVEELQGRRFVLALGVNDGSLLARIRRIVGAGSDRTPHERWPAALLGLVLLGVMCALSITWSAAAPDDVRLEPRPVIGPTPERENGQLQELVAWSADSAQVFTTTTFIRLMRWERNGAALKLKASEIPGNEAFAHANSMAVASRSGRIVLGTNRGTVQFWDADLLQVQKQIAVEPDTDRYPTYAVAISPDESVVAEFGWSGHLYDMATMKCICLFGERAKRRMSVLAFAPNGRALVGLDRDGLLTLWNIPNGTKIADWSLQHISEHATVQWSQEGDLIAVVSDGTVAFVTPTLGSTPRVVIAPDAVCQMTPEDTLIESRVRRADLPDGIDFAGVMALAPDFKTVASVKIDASVTIWDVETREVISRLAAPPSAHNVENAGAYMQRLTFSPNGRHLACTREVEGDLIYWTLSVEPLENARVRIRSADGSPAALNGLVHASVGFSALKVPPWSAFATKGGVVPLDDLPPGTHWLVAKADSEERTAVPVTLPRPGSMIERRLQSPAGWVSKEIELKPSVDRTDPHEEMIVVELHNASGADITVTEDDFSLTMHPDSYRVFAPRRRSAAAGHATRLTIADGNSGTIQLSWQRWIREGLWASRIFEHISEPWSVNSEVGKIQVRVNLGNRGSLPVFVTAPNAIAAAPRPAATDEAAAYKPFDCEIVDAVTGKLIEEAEFHFSFHFMKPATKDTLAKEVGHAIWAPKASSKLSFVIPDKVLQHPDRDKLVVEWFVRHPKYETLVSKEPVSLLSVLADEPESARDTFRKIKLTPKKVVGATAPAKGLEFLKPYPNLHGLSLAMTEPQFRAFAKKGELILQMTPRANDRSTYSIPTGDGYTVIVVFQSGKCGGIQRIRGEDRVDKISFESVTATFKAALGNDQPQQIQIKADGSCVYHIDGRPARGDIQKRPEARLTSKISPQRMLELERLLAKTNWLTVAGGEGPPRHTDAGEITITVVRDDQTKTVVCLGTRPEPYHSLLWFLRGIAEQEKLVYAIDWLHGHDTDRKQALNPSNSDRQSKDSNTNPDPPSNEAAEFGDLRQTQVIAEIPDAEYRRPTADDQKATALIPAEAWGSPVRGLRAAILMQSPPVDQKDSLRYRLVVENVSNHDIRFSATVAPDFRDFHLDLCTLSLFGSDDEPLPREKPNLVSYVVQPWLSRFWLKAGERAFVRRDGRRALARLDLQGLPVSKPQPQRASAFFKVRPGRYSVSAAVELGRETRSTSPGGIPTVLSPAKGEWSGKLKTGTLPVALFDDSGRATGKYLATARPKQPELMVGEPGWILFEVHNQTDIDKRVIVGGDYRNALGRPDSFKVDVFDADGRSVAQPSISIDMGGIRHPMPLPAKQSAGFELFLPHWATITKPGKYRFTVWRELDVIPSEKDSTGQDPFALKPDKVLVAAETAFTVVARDEAKFGELIERLGPMLIREDEAQLADQMLRAIRVPLEWSQRAASTPDTGELAPDERAVPWYLKYLAQTHSARKRTALRFLGECRSEMAFDAIVMSFDVTADDIRGTPTRELAESSAHSVHQAATQALATFATNQPLHPRATKRLFALADHPHMPVRLTVLHFAAKVKTREARAIIETMTDDKDERLATEAKRYQKLLADGQSGF